MHALRHRNEIARPQPVFRSPLRPGCKRSRPGASHRRRSQPPKMCTYHLRVWRRFRSFLGPGDDRESLPHQAAKMPGSDIQSISPAACRIPLEATRSCKRENNPWFPSRGFPIVLERRTRARETTLRRSQPFPQGSQVPSM